MGEERGFEELDPGPVPPLTERVREVLLEPRAAFRRHDAAWGWTGPFVLVALAGLVQGLVYMARVDITAVQAAASERQMEQLDPAVRRRVESDPKVKEMTETTQRFTAFASKVAVFVWPPVGGVGGLLLAGGLCFGAAQVLRLRRSDAPRPDLMRSISLAAHVSLVNLVGLAATTVGALSGNPMPYTSAANLVDPFAQPVVSAGLSRLDPVLLLYYGVLAAGLEGSLRFPRRLALAGAAGAYLLISLAVVGFTGAMTLLGQMAGGGAS